jgi:hypothetical protein
MLLEVFLVLPGVAGPPGPDGEDGQSGIQTLCKWFTGSGLLGTVPANALISGLWAIVYSWNTPHDTGTFELEANSVTEISTVVDLTQQAPNFVLCLVKNSLIVNKSLLDHWLQWIQTLIL